jgi:hypothetical protein
MADTKTLWMATLFIIFCMLLSTVGVIKTIGDKKTKSLNELSLTTKIANIETQQKDIEYRVTEISNENTDDKYDKALISLKSDLNKTKEQLISMIPSQRVYTPTASCLLNNNSTNGIISLECVKE